jgi:hypothetical protein
MYTIESTRASQPSHRHAPRCSNLARLPLGFLQRLHRDDAGNLGILLLLTVWALVLLIALVWNTGEISSRRSHIQNASDTSAHSLATWMARATNQESATNMAIGENASANILLISVQPAIDQIAARLTAEEKNLKHRLYGDIPQKAEPIPDFEYYEHLLNVQSWTDVSTGAELGGKLATITQLANQIDAALGNKISPAQHAAIDNNTIKNAQNDALAIGYMDINWLKGDHVHLPLGFDPPPMFGDQWGVDVALADWVADGHRRFDAILNALPNEWAVWQTFIDHTSPAMATDPPSLAVKRNDIFQFQIKFTDDLPAAAEQQRRKMAELYKTNVTIADPVLGSSGGTGTQPAPNSNVAPEYLGATIHAPVMEANMVPPAEHLDSIRMKYPDEALIEFGTLDPNVLIDPINVNMDDARLWHPGASVQWTVSPQGSPHTYRVVSAQYGAIQCAPLARFVNDRVSRDEAGLANLLQNLDTIRAAVRGQVHPAPWVPNPIPQINMTQRRNTNQPFSLNYRPIQQLPKPAGITPDLAQAIADVNTLIQQVNKDGPQFVAAVSRLYTNQPKLGISPIENFSIAIANEIDGTTQNFAVQVWLNNVESSRYNVLKEMGYTKGFMVLKPYALRPIPEWARASQQQSAYQTVYNDVYNRSLGGTQAGWNYYQWNTYTHWTGLYNTVYNDIVQDMLAQGASGTVAAQTANANAPLLARQICAAAAAIVAQDVANEWVSRPWPYEITPPANPSDENCAGWLNVDRPQFFTLMVGATNTAENRPVFALPKFMGQGPATLATFAQAEAFNWMEYHPAYGAGDRYDLVSNYGHNVLSGSPAPWRLSTPGGWSWQPRLALSDQLPPSVNLNPDLHTQFEAGGVPGMDEAALKALILH